MKKIALIFGLIAGIIPSAMFFIMHNDGGFEASQMENGQIIGYITMIVGFSTIFFAIKQYRDNELNGQIKFGKAFLVGLYITLVASLVYVVAWEVYSNTLMIGDFSDQYVEYIRGDLAAKGLTEAEIDVELAPQLDMMKLYKENMPFRLAMTFMEIFPVGLIISLISALVFGVILNKKQIQGVDLNQPTA